MRARGSPTSNTK
jgi:hypothetical protein